MAEAAGNRQRERNRETEEEKERGRERGRLTLCVNQSIRQSFMCTLIYSFLAKLPPLTHTDSLCVIRDSSLVIRESWLKEHEICLPFNCSSTNFRVERAKRF